MYKDAIQYRIGSFVVIFSFVSILIYFHFQNSHFTANHLKHDENRIEIPLTVEPPAVNGTVQQDYSGSWYIQLETDNFRFAPEKVGLDTVTYHEGHAHLYINGKKINRIYGEYYNLDYLKDGEYIIRVTLHGNNHGLFTYDSKVVGFEEKINVK